MSFYKLWNTPPDPEEDMITLWEGSEKTPPMTEGMPLQENKAWLKNQPELQQVAYTPPSQVIQHQAVIDAPQQQGYNVQAPQPVKPWQQKASGGKALLMGLLGTLAGGVGTGLQTGLGYYQNKNQAYQQAYQSYLDALNKVKTQRGQGQANLAQLNAGGFNKYAQGLNDVDPYYFSSIDDLKKGVELSGNFRYDPQYQYDQNGNPVGLARESQYQGMPMGKDNAGFKSWQEARKQSFDSELANIEAEISRLNGLGEPIPPSLLQKQQQLFGLGAVSGRKPMSVKEELEVGPGIAKTEAEIEAAEALKGEREASTRKTTLETDLLESYGPELKQVEIDYKKAQAGNEASQQKINQLKQRAMETLNDPNASEDDKFFARQVLNRTEEDVTGSTITDPPSVRQEEERKRQLSILNRDVAPTKGLDRDQRKRWKDASLSERAQMLGLDYNELQKPVSSGKLPSEFKPFENGLSESDKEAIINADPSTRKKMLQHIKQKLGQ